MAHLTHTHTKSKLHAPHKNPDAVRKEVNAAIDTLKAGSAAFEQSSHEVLRTINTALLESELAAKKIEKTLKSADDPLAEKINKAIEDFVGEE